MPGASRLPLASEFRVKKGNIFLGATGSGLLGVIAPTDEEFAIVDPYDDRLPPTGHIVLLIKACSKHK